MATTLNTTGGGPAQGATGCPRAANPGTPGPPPADLTPLAEPESAPLGNARVADRESVAADRRRERADLREGVADRRQASADLREGVADQRQASADLREGVADQRQETADRREGVADQRQESADRREGVADQRQDSADRREGVADQRQESADRREGVADQRQDSADLREGVADRRQASADLREGVADQRQETADLREGVADQRQESADLRQEAANLREEVADRRQEAAELREEVADRRQEAAELREEVANLREIAARAKAELAADAAAQLRDANEHLVVASVKALALIEVAEQARAQMAYLAMHDPLTGLPNRTLLTDRLAQAITLAERHGTKVALMYLDLDHFKQINDTLGHPVGDQLLQSAAGRLQACVRHSDSVSRVGGDEFVVLLAAVMAAPDAVRTAEKVLRALAEPHLIGDHRLQVTLSIGISLYPYDGADAAALIANADLAMYHAKRGGGNRYQQFTADMTGG